MATIGTITYPTADTWEVQVTDVAGTQMFTVSDGTNTTQVTAIGLDPTLAPAVNAIASPTNDDPIIITGSVPSFLAGSVAASATTAAALTVPKPLAAALTIAATTSAALTVPKPLAGSVAVTATAAADLTAPGQVLQPTMPPVVSVISSPTSDNPILITGYVPNASIDLAGVVSVSIALSANMAAQGASRAARMKRRFNYGFNPGLGR